MRNSIRITMSGMLICAVAACGGGGGGGATSGTGATVPSLLVLTAGNAEAVSAEVTVAGSDTVGAGDIGSSLIAGVVVDAGDRPALSEVTRWSLETLHGLRDQMAVTVSGVVVNDSVSCTSGSISVSWDDVDNDNEFSSGDSFSMTFSNCVEMGATINGSLAMSSFIITGNPDVDIAWNMGAAFTFTALTMNDGVDSVRVDGGMNFSIATLNSDDFEVDINGTSLAYLEGGYTTTLSDYSFSYAEELSSGLYSMEYAGIVNIGSLSGRVSFTTTVPFTGSNILEDWPTAGTLMISGANASTSSLEALGGDTVRLSIDANGDGGVDQTIDTTWTALTAI